MTETHPLRDHGRGDPGPVKGTPTIGASTGIDCPACGATGLFDVVVTLENAPPQLAVPEGSEPVGIYMGCAACPFASPMMMTARRKASE